MLHVPKPPNPDRVVALVHVSDAELLQMARNGIVITSAASISKLYQRFKQIYNVIGKLKQVV